METAMFITSCPSDYTNHKETYIGLCNTTFKLNYRNICSFRNEWYKHTKELSKHIWSMKDKNIMTSNGRN